jgi:hypothetical protein
MKILVVNVVRALTLVAVPGWLIGWILFTLAAPWWIWFIFALYLVDRLAIIGMMTK